MHVRQSCTTFLASSLLVLGQIMHASGGTLSLDIGKNVELQPAGSGTFTFSATTGNEAPEDFIAWSIAFQVVPSGSVTGSLSVGVPPNALPITSSVGTEFSGSLTNPVVNPILNDTSGADLSQPRMYLLGSSAVINSLTTYIGMGGTITEDYPTLSPTTSYGIASVGFSVSGGVPGDTWTVYAVQQQGSTLLKTYWIGDNGDEPFQNIPFASGGNYAIAVGSISVVPEPSTLLLAGPAIIAGGWYLSRKRRSLAAVQG